MDTLFNAYIGYIVVAVIAIGVGTRSWNKKTDIILNLCLTFAILLFTQVLFGFRSLDFPLYSDQSNYISYFQNHEKIPYTTILSEIDLFSESLYFIFNKLIGDFLGYDNRIFFICIALLYVFLFILYSFKISRRSFGIVLFFYVSYFFFYGPAMTVLRNGLALGFDLIGVYYIFSKKNNKGILFLLLGIGFHSSTFFLIAGIVVSYFLNIEKSLIIWGIASIVSFLGGNAKNLLQLILTSNIALEDKTMGTQDVYQNYTQYKLGFRYDFFLFSAFYVVLIAFLVYKKKFEDELFLKYAKLYIILNAFFIFSFGIPFCDRYGLYSWIFIPALLTIPFLNYNLYTSNIRLIITLLHVVFGLYTIFYVYEYTSTVAKLIQNGLFQF